MAPPPAAAAVRTSGSKGLDAEGKTRAACGRSANSAGEDERLGTRNPWKSVSRSGVSSPAGKINALPRRDGGVYRAAVGVLREPPVVTRSIRAAAIALERRVGLYASRELMRSTTEFADWLVSESEFEKTTKEPPAPKNKQPDR